MAYSLQTVNEALRSDPKGFVAECDEKFRRQTVAAARSIAENRKNSAIVLLSGPSGSGKTTTSLKICEELERLGIRSHAVAMDNYFETVDPETSPRNASGELDFESPFCLDIPLLNQHMSMLEKGELVYVPTFDFSRQMQIRTRSHPLRLKKDEIAVFEGIHALNDIFTGRNLEASRLYISARSNYTDGAGSICCKGTWVRLCRRFMRDSKFRGHTADFTLKLWPSVRRGEQLYISPFKENATFIFDSMQPYEMACYRNSVIPLLENVTLPEGYDKARAEAVAKLKNILPDFEPLDESYVPADALIREFLGGGIYEY